MKKIFLALMILTLLVLSLSADQTKLYLFSKIEQKIPQILIKNKGEIFNEALEMNITLSNYDIIKSVNVYKTDNIQLINNKDNVFEVINYSKELKGPKYVIYILNPKSVAPGKKKRLGFKEDQRIPKEFRNKNSWYVGSGFDKGHGAHDAGFDYDINLLRSTYLLSNSFPETPLANRHTIKSIESTERELARDRYVYVVTGGIYNYPLKRFLKNNKEYQAVPILIYKIIFWRYKDKDNSMLDIDHYLFLIIKNK